MDASKLKSDLAGFTGTEAYHRLSIFPGVVGTDGVAYLCKTAGCFWLFDIIVSYQSRCKKDPMLRDFQVWKLKAKDGKGVVTCERDKDEVAIRQAIPYTDFPLDEIMLYVEAGECGGRPVMVCMLPSER